MKYTSLALELLLAGFVSEERQDQPKTPGPASGVDWDPEGQEASWFFHILSVSLYHICPLVSIYIHIHAYVCIFYV